MDLVVRTSHPVLSRMLAPVTRD